MGGVTFLLIPKSEKDSMKKEICKSYSLRNTERKALKKILANLILKKDYISLPPLPPFKK